MSDVAPEPSRRPGRSPWVASVLVAVLVLSACGGAAPDGRPVRAAAPSAAPEAGAALRAMVYNIRAGTDLEGEPNLERVAALILGENADIVLLQEVDRGTERSGGVDQVAELERLTGYHGAFGRTLDYQGGEYGIALLSRWPIAADTLIHLPVEPPQERAGGSYEPRGALVVRVSAPAGQLGVVNTHLDASGDDHYRRQEVEEVRRLAGDLVDRGIPVLVGGDFNAEPGSAVIQRLEAGGWTDAWARCGVGAADGLTSPSDARGQPGAGARQGLTYPSDAPVKRIDYLFLSGGLTCSAARVLETTTSDHRPVIVEVTPANE